MRKLLVFTAIALLGAPLRHAGAQVPPVPPVPPVAPTAPVAPGDDADDDDAPVKRGRHGHRDGRVNVGGSVTVGPDETVREAVSIGGSTTIAGHVKGAAVAFGGSVVLKKGSHVEGDAVAIGGPVEVEDGATLEGDRVSIAPFLGAAGLFGLAGTLGTLALFWTLAGTLLEILGLLALGALFLAFIPERVERMKRTLVTRPLPAGGVGMLAFIGLVPATVLLIVTIVGILLVPFLWMFFGLFVALGLTLVALLIGEKLPLKGNLRGPFPTLAIGALLLIVVRLVPFLGTVVFFAAMVVGVGAVLLSRGGAPVASTTPAVFDELPPATTGE